MTTLGQNEMKPSGGLPLALRLTEGLATVFKVKPIVRAAMSQNLLNA